METAITCPACGEIIMGAYTGPAKGESVLRWAQEEHAKISPDCDHQFSKIKLHRMKPDEPEEDYPHFFQWCE